VWRQVLVLCAEVLRRATQQPLSAVALATIAFGDCAGVDDCCA